MARRTKRSYSRADRINQQLLEVISAAMLTEVRDPRARDVQISAVEVTQDLSHARVYYVMLKEDPRDEIQGVLERLAGFIRKHVAHQLQIKHVPDLQFKYDESVERGRRMEHILSGVTHPNEEE